MANLLSALDDEGFHELVQEFDVYQASNKFTIRVPISNADVFESALQKVRPQTYDALMSIVKQYSGEFVNG